MAINPVYGARPEEDLAQIRALRLFPRHEWRGPGCGDRCVRVFVGLLSGGGYEVVDAHDGAAHEAYVHAQYAPHVVRTGVLTVDLDDRRVYVNDTEVLLPNVSYRLLARLASHLGQVVTHDEILAAIDPQLVTAHSERYLSSAMTRVRAALGPAGCLIETRITFGFMLREEAPVRGAP